MYNKILIPLDFHGDNSEIIEKAQAIAKTNDAEMFLIHVNETLAVAYAVDGLSWNDQIVNLDASIRKEAQKRMSEIASSLSIPEENCFNRDGRPAAEIHELAKEKDIDLIMLFYFRQLIL